MLWAWAELRAWRKGWLVRTNLYLNFSTTLTQTVSWVCKEWVTNNKMPTFVLSMSLLPLQLLLSTMMMIILIMGASYWIFNICQAQCKMRYISYLLHSSKQLYEIMWISFTTTLSSRSRSVGPEIEEPGLEGPQRDSEASGPHQPAQTFSAAGTKKPSGYLVPWSHQLPFQWRVLPVLSSCTSHPGKTPRPQQAVKRPCCPVIIQQKWCLSGLNVCGALWHIPYEP